MRRSGSPEISALRLIKPRYEKLRQALTRKAEGMIADGVLELNGRAW